MQWGHPPRYLIFGARNYQGGLSPLLFQSRRSWREAGPGACDASGDGRPRPSCREPGALRLWPWPSVPCLWGPRKRHPRNAKRAAALCVPVPEPRAQKQRWGSPESRGQEDSVSADPFIRKIADAKGTHGNIVIGKSIFLKNFYKWKLPQVQAIFKNTTTWVAGRREQLCSDVSLKG